MTATQPKPYTAEEYFALEVESPIRSEYRNGEIVPMTGGTPDHNQIISPLNALLWFGLRGKPYHLFITDQRLWIPAQNLYTYPDAMVIPSPIKLQPGRKDTVTNPILIAEVFSADWLTKVLKPLLLRWWGQRLKSRLQEQCLPTQTKYIKGSSNPRRRISFL